MASHLFTETVADPLDYDIELGLDFSARVYEDYDSGNYTIFERTPRLYINGKVYDLPKEISDKLEEIIGEYYESINYE